MFQNFKLAIGFLIALHITLSANSIDADIRSQSTVNLVKGSKTTNIPYGYFVSDFGKSSIKGFDKIDLSNYPDKHLLVGYGVYDINEENCRYLDVPSNKTFDTDFSYRTIIGKNTYGVSRKKYSYSKCLSKVAQYSGFVFTPKDLLEYNNVAYSLKIDKQDVWVGYSRKDCSKNYLNDEGFEQSFENFFHKDERCDESKRFTVKPSSVSSWFRRDSSESHYCVIKINSPDYLRPIKFCLPWWRVERQWHRDENDDKFEYNGKMYDFKYMQYIIDYTKDKTICTKKVVDQNAPSIPERFKQTCQSYSYYKESPECARDISLPICKINQCKGAVMNTCLKVSSFSPSPKDYAIGYIKDENGDTKKVKMKDKIVIHIYDCPVLSVSAKTCLKKERVSVFPVECGNYCHDFISCLQDNNTTVQDNNTTVQENNTTSKTEQCFKKFPCEKTYGSTDSIVFDKNGEAVGLRGVCKDGVTEKIAPIEKKSTTKTVCSEYNMIEKKTTLEKSCISEATSSLKTVPTSITGKDIYAKNERCIRINNEEEARPPIHPVFKYKTKNFFKIEIVKALIDGNETRFDTNSSDIVTELSSSLKLKHFDSNYPRKIDTTVMDSTLAKCEEILPSSNLEKREYLLSNSYPNSKLSLVGFLKTTSAPNINKCPIGYKVAHDRCERVVVACNGAYDSLKDSCKGSFSCSSPDLRQANTCYQSYSFSYPIIGVVSAKENIADISSATGLQKTTKGVLFSDYEFASLGITENELKTLFFVGGDLIIGDMFDSIKRTSSEVLNVFTSNSKTSSECDTIAKCLSGEVSVNNSKCHIKISNLKEAGEQPSKVAKYKAPVPLKLPLGEGSIVANFNGIHDIYSIQEYTNGDFGYFSNYESAIPENNIVTVNDREIFPIINNDYVVSSINFDYDIVTTTQITKHRSPDQYAGYNSGYTPSYLFKYEPSANGLATAIGDNATTETVLGFATLGLSEIVMLFGHKESFGWYKSHYTVSKNINSIRYVQNVYNYDARIIKNAKLLYAQKDVFTGTLKKNDFLMMRDNIKAQKKSDLQLQGYTGTSFTKMTSLNAETLVPSWNGNIHWYDRSKKSTKTESSIGSMNITKKLSTIYMGATNTISIVVPYSGDYEVVAYDKYNDILSSKVILNENFISGNSDNGSTTEKYAQVQFATANNFNIAIGQDNHKIDGSCLISNYVEWGGGVSGIYYEEGVPDLNNLCKKSTDEYVKSHSATKITVRATNSPVLFEIKLKKPLPFPNRVMLVNFMHLENRKYECFTKIDTCSVASSKSNK